MSKVSKGLAWSAVDHFSVQAVQFVLSIIIARLVSPSSYGVIVMVQVFLAFAQLFIDSGFKSALIQKKDRTDIDFYTVFNFNLVMSLLLYGIMFFSAPAIAAFYGEPMLTPLTRVVSLNLVFSSLSIVQLVHLQVNLDFKTQAKARLLSVFISGTVGVICAYRGMEVWALAIQGVVSTLVTSICLMYFSRWRPKWIFSTTSFKQLFAFGSKLLMGGFITTGYIQLTNLIIGKVYTSANLAYYNRAFQLALLPSSNISEVISRTVYPIFCELQNNRQSLLQKFEQFLRLSCLIIFPIMALVGVFSKPLIVVLLTQRWADTAPLLSIMCIVFVVYPILQISGQIVLAAGYSGYWLKFSIVKRVIAFVSLLVTLPIGVNAIAWGLVFSNLCETFISVYCLKAIFNYPYHRMVFVLSPIILLTACSTASAGFTILLIENCYMQLIVGLATGMVVYVIGLFILKLPERNYLLAIIRKSSNK